MVSWHHIPGAIIICIYFRARAGVFLWEREGRSVSAANRAVYFSAAANTDFWNILRIGTDFLPGNHKIWFSISIFSLPPWELQNMIEFLRSLGINNRLHNICIFAELTDRLRHRGDLLRIPLGLYAAIFLLSYNLVEYICKNTETVKLNAYINCRVHLFTSIFCSVKSTFCIKCDIVHLNVKLFSLVFYQGALHSDYKLFLLRSFDS